MNPTLKQGQIVLGKHSDNIELNINNIIAFKFQNKTLIKRVVGLPSDEVRIVDNYIYINEELKFTYIIKKEQFYEWKVPRDQLCIIGDNPNNSLDSRKIGLIKFDQVKYKIIARIWPPKLL